MVVVVVVVRKFRCRLPFLFLLSLNSTRHGAQKIEPGARTQSLSQLSHSKLSTSTTTAFFDFFFLSSVKDGNFLLFFPALVKTFWFGLARERARRFREPPTSSLTPRHQSPHHQSEDRACLCNNCRH